MASIRKRGDRWHVEVYRLGQRRAKSFDTKRAAQTWAHVTEADLEAKLARGVYSETGPGIRTVDDMLVRYRDDVTPAKRGAKNEVNRINRMRRETIAAVPLTSLSAVEVAAWRDERLTQVQPASVRRDMILFVTICYRAIKEWKWLTDNPCTDVAKPKEPPPRERRITDAEIRALAHVCGWRLDDPTQMAVTAPQRVCAAFLFAIETGMRAGEICGLTDLDRGKRVARLDMTKNGYGRDVPLSPAALAILDRLPGGVFDLTTGTLDALFRKYRDKAIIADMHFHDSRHEAVSRLALRLDVLDLARMIGHRDIRMLMRYYHRTASDVAGQLAGE